ncbi:hypothetical protein [Sphaerimonospora thailandensis]|uniref:Uncharacterized protein n=1 Tax=Sphaerimonospora thailandensis TaxID=795644 RepID=A0A8J3RAJ4_9ACTN|nr:hypothetical protein [Sphaerimonospora thailandensis]GIH70362.1 hypothetical protein Mth01_26150 [Sphaerimonospora thailandensis]
MDTAAAAIQAGVTAATIRTWCRIGAIAAAKVAGRWAIDAASLAYRITLGVKPQPAPKPIVYSVDTMTAIGGSEWIRGDKHRVYINNWAEFAGLEVSRYNTGNISYAEWDGEKISNSQANKILSSIDKVWFDTATGKLHCRYGWGESRVATREEVWAAVVAGIRAAIAAL